MRANFALTLFVLLILVDCFQDRALCDENGLCSAVRLWVPMLKIPNTHCKTSASFLQCRCNIDAVPLQLFLQCYCNAFAVLLQKMCSRFAVRACDEKAMGVLSFLRNMCYLCHTCNLNSSSYGIEWQTLSDRDTEF